MSDRDRADEVYAELLTRQGEQWVQPRVERTKRALDLLGDPQRAYRVVHLTGTNGKTSTARIVQSLLQTMGLRTALFTSPHLARFTERIVIDGEPVKDAAIADAWEEIAPIVRIVDDELKAAGDAPLTFFELLTVLAFVVAADAPVDVLVLEVGMGGSWDSTNAADGDVAVITPIDIDHADRLGGTIGEIAGVKAGIIKPGAIAVSAAQSPEAARALRARADLQGARLVTAGTDFGVEEATPAVGGQLVRLRSLAGAHAPVFLPLHGVHQAENAALAVAAVEALVGGGDLPLTGDVLEQGLAEVLSPGRLQLVGNAPTIVVDAAHNPHGARALAAALPVAFGERDWALVLGVLSDKDAAGIADALVPLATAVYVTTPDSDRAGDPDALADLVEERGGTAIVAPELDDALEQARVWAAADAENRGVVVAGSVVLAGEAIGLARRSGWLGEVVR